MTPEQMSLKEAAEIVRLGWYDGNFSDVQARFDELVTASAILSLIAQIEALTARAERAERALVRGGFVDNGGQEWKPPLGPAPKFIEVEALTVPQVAVSVERGGVYIIRGVQSFRLAYEGETQAEKDWYAGQLRSALGQLSGNSVEAGQGEDSARLECAHANGRTASWDWITCDDCGAIYTGAGEREWGVAQNMWFKSVSEAKFYKANGRYPDRARASAETGGVKP